MPHVRDTKDANKPSKPERKLPVRAVQSNTTAHDKSIPRRLAVRLGPPSRLPGWNISRHPARSYKAYAEPAMGHEVRLPAELASGTAKTRDGFPITSYGEFVDRLRQRMQHAHDIARRHLSSAAKRSKDLYDTKIALKKYNEGAQFGSCTRHER